MDTTLTDKVLAFIVKEWNEGNRAISSEDLYAQLTASGEVVPEGAMDAILTKFTQSGIIRSVGFLNSEAVRQHGAMAITWVNPAYL